MTKWEYFILCTHVGKHHKFGTKRIVIFKTVTSYQIQGWIEICNFILSCVSLTNLYKSYFISEVFTVSQNVFDVKCFNE